MITTGVILAGGLGTRLLPLTENKPKCLVEVDGKPMIAYALDQFRQANIEDVVIISPAKYRQDVIDAAMVWSRVARLDIVDEPEPEGEVAALMLAKHYIADRHAIIGMVDCIIPDFCVASFLKSKRMIRSGNDNDAPIFLSAEWECLHSLYMNGKMRLKPKLKALIGWCSFVDAPNSIRDPMIMHEGFSGGGYFMDTIAAKWYDCGSLDGIRRAEADVIGGNTPA